jgi:hypothetical protein
MKRLGSWHVFDFSEACFNPVKITILSAFVPFECVQ